MIRFNKYDSDDDIRIKQELQTFEGMNKDDIYQLLYGMSVSGSTVDVQLEPLYGMFNTNDINELSESLFDYVNYPQESRRCYKLI